MLGSGRVEFFGGCDYLGERAFVSRVSGSATRCRRGAGSSTRATCRPTSRRSRSARFEVEDGARVIPVNDLVRLEEAPSQYVVVGSGKTATDACIWLLARGVDPDAICWVRPRDPWMLNRALIQPDPAIYLAMFADLMEAAGTAPSLPDLFLRLEDAGIMLRVDRSVTPTMAKAPTLGTWELELLRTIEHVVRLGHIESVRRGRIDLRNGSVAVADDAVVVDCAADGLKRPPRVPIWGPEVITLQPIRAGFPCFGAALAAYVEATRDDDDEKNRLCPPSSFGNTLADWAAMNVLGVRSSASFGVRARHQGVVRPGRTQPRSDPSGLRQLGRAGRCARPPAGTPARRRGATGRAERHGLTRVGPRSRS